MGGAGYWAGEICFSFAETRYACFQAALWPFGVLVFVKTNTLQYSTLKSRRPCDCFFRLPNA